MTTRFRIQIAAAAVVAARAFCAAEGNEEVAAESPSSPQDLVVFDHLIQPILEQNCLSCHDSDKLKGELNLETYEGMLEGGELGPAIVPGNALDSELQFRITLPRNDDETMPPEDKSPLRAAEIDLITWWINQGASQSEKLAAFEQPPAPLDGYIAEIFATEHSPEAMRQREVERQEVYQAFAELNDKLGILVAPLEPGGMEFSLDTFSAQKRFGDAMLQQLEPYASHIVEADLSGTQVSDASFDSLSKFSNLRFLNLSKTNLSGEGVSQLAELPNLTYLNLYGAPLAEPAVEELSQLKQLKQLFLFQTKLDQEPFTDQLQVSLPDTQIGLN